MSLLLASCFLQALAAALAVMLARRQHEHRPFAALLAYTTVTTAIRLPLQHWIMTPASIALGGDPAHGIPPALPLSGWARVAAHIDHALFLGWSAAFAVVVLWVFLPSERWTQRLARGYAVPVVVWVGMIAYFVITYPDSRPYHRQGYLFAELAALLVGAAVFVGWVRRAWRVDGMSVTRLCMLLILLLDGAGMLGPYLAPSFFAAWDGARVAYIILYVLLILVQGGSLWTHK
jgi:hypothetical protein